MVVFSAVVGVVGTQGVSLHIPQFLISSVEHLMPTDKICFTCKSVIKNMIRRMILINLLIDSLVLRCSVDVQLQYFSKGFFETCQRNIEIR